MIRNNNDNADKPGQPDLSSRDENGLPTESPRRNSDSSINCDYCDYADDLARREHDVIDHEADILCREQRVTAREEALDLREHDADMREEKADSQKRDSFAAETIQAASDLSRENQAAAREEALDLREQKADSLEWDINAAETTQAASVDHIILLQQANEHLVITTIEAQKLAEQLQAAQAQLEIAKDAAEKANLAKSDFLSSMSHELRSPLNAILGFAQLLETGSPPPTAGQMIRLHQIIEAGWYLVELINQILDLAVIESGKLSLSQEPVFLSDVINECHDMIEPQAQQRGITLTFLPFDHTWMVYADRTRVKQVLINLLSNALKYNREQGSIEVKCVLSPSERLRISIKDSGAGLPPEKLEQLFQPFNRLGQETGVEQGTGIGLVVTKQLVELMGGTIGVESTVGVGSEFWVELTPDLTMQHALRTVMPTEPAPQITENQTLHTLLYIEDNPANLMLIEHIIANHRHLTLLSAVDANLGIALARVHRPDVILMDINLPGISGIEALKILYKDPTTAHIPVVAVSANALPRDIEKGLKTGFFRYLTKPLKINEFINALDDALAFSETGLVDESVDANITGQPR